MYQHSLHEIQNLQWMAWLSQSQQHATVLVNIISSQSFLQQRWQKRIANIRTQVNKSKHKLQGISPFFVSWLKPFLTKIKGTRQIASAYMCSRIRSMSNIFLCPLCWKHLCWQPPLHHPSHNQQDSDDTIWISPLHAKNSKHLKIFLTEQSGSLFIFSAKQLNDLWPLQTQTSFAEELFIVHIRP